MNEYIIDEYKELLSQLEEVIKEGHITETDSLLVVRQSGDVDFKGNTICPVVDFFFSEPKLKENMLSIKVVEAKKMLFDILGEVEDAQVKEAVQLLIDYLKDYTANNNKRNDKNCLIVCVEESGFPMMIYFEEDQVSDTLEVITTGNLLAELNAIVKG
ncbi:MAG: hypothetical protein MJ093_09375 [Saccharofermentans sp.]|nr:hypothetical protein [Saccharofermentans sp.]